MSTTQVPQPTCSRPFGGDELSLVRKILRNRAEIMWTSWRAWFGGRRLKLEVLATLFLNRSLATA
jgi:hypothetical protein